LQVPVGVKAKVVIPDNVKNYRLNGKELNMKKGETSIPIESGKYTFLYKF